MRQGGRPPKSGGKPAKARVQTESARLRRALKTETARRRELGKNLAEALDQQTATSEILRVISSSPADIQPVLDTIVRRAVTLCGGMFGNVQRFDGELMHLGAQHGYDAEGLAAYRQMYPMPPRRTQTASRAVLTRSVVHVPDVLEDPEYAHELARAAGFRSLVSVPMFRGGDPIGVITVAGAEPKPFPDRQIALLKAFADQAVIAIENVRLFTEVQQKNSALTEAHARVTEALEQQTATSEVLRVISSSPTDLQPVAQAIADSAGRLCDCAYSAVFRLDGGLIHWVAARAASAAQQATLRDLWPRPPDRETLAGRTILARETVHVHDAAADPTYPGYGALAIRSFLGVPMLRAGQPIGVIGLVRTVVKPFSEREIALIQTFADQAVIAIENVRLFTEVQSRNRDLTEALEQQTATSEILRVISSSPTDIQPVLDAVAENAARLCEAVDAQIFRLEGDFLRRVASFGSIPIHTGRAMSRGWVTGRSVVDRKTIHVHDLAAESETEFPVGRETQKLFGHRTTLATPLLREEQPLGAVLIRRMEVRPFSDKQIKLLETFADQAVIAIENVRLFTEVQARNRDLTEALEQQTATSEVLKVISRSAFDLQPVLETLIESATRLCGATRGHVFRFDGGSLRFAAAYGASPGFVEYLERNPVRLGAGSVAGRAGAERRTVHVPDVLAEPEYQYLDLVKQQDYRAVLAVPMLREGALLGVITIVKPEATPFTDKQVDLVTTFADQAVIAIENVRLFKEVETRNRELTETLEQRTATSEILRAISGSPTDVQPVFDTIAENALRLCDGHFSAVVRFDGEFMHLVALNSATPEGREALERAYPRRPSPGGVTDQAVLTRAIAHVPDVLDDPGYGHRNLALAANYRSMLAVPLLREGSPIGVIAVTRAAVGLFPDNQVELLKTFAEQAVIAIENVRLFTEVQARNRDLTEALEQQTATGEILRVISSSPTDVQPVFDAIAHSAVRLCNAQFCAVFRFDGALLYFVAHDGLTPEGVAAYRQSYPMAPGRGSAAARSVLAGAVEHIPDIQADPDYAHGALARVVTLRSIVAAPMLRDGVPIGTIVVARSEMGRFPDTRIALLRTFADQAVIAIENVRLFTELQQKNTALTTAHAQVSEALERQTATAEILRVISQSPTDVQPVFDLIAERAAPLCGANASVVSRFDGTLLQLAALHGVTQEAVDTVRRVFPMRLDAVTTTARAFRERALVHVADVLDNPSYATRDAALAGGWRAGLAAPMLREGQVIGVIFVGRSAPGLFSPQQVELLTTFADQAVIAIENVRLFTELGARNRELTETLEQQTATAEVLKVISRSTFDLQPILETLVENATRLCAAEWGIIYRFDGEALRVAAFHNAPAGFIEFWRQAELRPGRGSAAARAALDRRTVHIPDVLADPEYDLAQAQRLGGYRTLLCVPMLREGALIGVFVLCRNEVRPFVERQIDLVTTFADQAAIAIENVRLFTELGARNRELTETLEQQTATSELLKVIGRSTFDLQPVFETLAENAVRLCEARQAFIFRFDGQVLRVVATHNASPELRAFLERTPTPPGRGSVAGRAALERRTVHIADVRTDPEYTWGARQVDPIRSVLAIPMLRGDELLGVIGVNRHEVRVFSDSQVALLETFADQAAIAIENARLVNELQERTAQLTRSVQELRALSEVSQAISSTLDLEAVLETIVSRAVELSGSHSGLVYEFDEATQTFHARATHRITPEHLEAVRAAPIRLGEGVVGRAGVIREPVQVADVESEGQLVAPQVRALVARDALRSLLAVPLVREGRLLGGLVILRRERGAFSPEVVGTLQTLAAQSVLAIHNARLFREIQSQKQYSETLVQTSPVAIATMDLNGTVVGWNPGAERLFGYTQAEAIGHPVFDLVSTPEIRDEVQTSLREQAHLRETVPGERTRTITRRARKDGTVVDVEVSSVPVVVDGAEVGYIAIYHDITELLEARREAEAANEAKSAFLATMSHEIRTPMNAVIGMSGLLLGTPLSDEQHEYAEVIRQSGDALLTVINDILDFSKIEAGKLELESQPFDLRECVEGALDLVAARAAEKGLDLAYLIADETPATIAGDVTRLRQILLNLLSNAVKFTERGEVVLSVSACGLDGPPALYELTFSVCDTGIGIPPDRLGRLFQSFSQGDASTTRRYGGTGLGLAISQRLTELMGGRIDVTSEVGRGSEFRFTIRAAAADAPPSARRDLGGVQPSLRGKRVLAVDDNATNRRILAAQLESWGMVPVATGLPNEALGWIRAGQRFDVGILDMHMPEMDGVTLARAMREHPAGTALPLVLFTSLGRREARAESEGFAAYLHKPIKPSQLFDALASILADQPVHVSVRGVDRSELDPDMARRHPLRILLAEDNVVNQKVALRLLGQMGYLADVAGNGIEAIDAVARQTYDVILMDVQMPELDGFEASREINRRWPGERRPRIVAMTANAMQGDRELCVASGMDDYVSKPIRVEELVGALERCRRRPEAQARVEPAAGAREALSESRAPSPARGEGVAPPAAAKEPAGVPGAIDRAAIDRLTATMGRGFVAELIDTFVADARELIAALRRALVEGDVDSFRRAAHSLKSTSEALGATDLAARARELEALARAGSLAGAHDRLEPLVRVYENVSHALGQLRHDLPA